MEENKKIKYFVNTERGLRCKVMREDKRLKKKFTWNLDCPFLILWSVLKKGISKLDLMSLRIVQKYFSLKSEQLQRKMKQSSYVNLQVSCGQQDISSPPTKNIKKSKSARWRLRGMKKKRKKNNKTIKWFKFFCCSKLNAWKGKNILWSDINKKYERFAVFNDAIFNFISIRESSWLCLVEDFD